MENEAEAVANSVMSQEKSTLSPAASRIRKITSSQMVQRQAETAGTIILIDAGPIGWAILATIAIGATIYVATRPSPATPIAPSPQLPDLSRAVEAIKSAVAGTLMAMSIADGVREVSDAIEDALNQNPQQRMRCSAEVIRFRQARDALLDALSRPSEIGDLQIIRLRDAFLLAANALLICMGIDPLF